MPRYTPHLAGALFALTLIAQLPAQSDEHIALRYATFDPLLGEPQVPEMLRAESRNLLHVVQFADKPTERMRQAVRDLGGEVKGFLPHRAHLVKMDAAAALRIAQLPFVRWIGAYHIALALAGNVLAFSQAGPTILDCGEGSDSVGYDCWKKQLHYAVG